MEVVPDVRPSQAYWNGVGNRPEARSNVLRRMQRLDETRTELQQLDVLETRTVRQRLDELDVHELRQRRVDLDVLNDGNDLSNLTHTNCTATS